MTELYPVFFATAVFLVLSGLEIIFFKLLNKRWWQKKWIRRASFFLPLAGLISILVWTLGIFSFKKTIMIIGSAMAAVVLVLILALLLALPVSGIFNKIYDWLEKRAGRSRKEKTSEPVGEIIDGEIIPRRRFLKGAAAVVPAISMSAGISGIAHAFTDIKVYKKPIYFEDLPPALEGLKILHLSDIHIGYYVWLDDIEKLLEDAGEFNPDIILATGDLSDRLDVYSDLLNLFNQFQAPLGVYGSIGNHEYYRGFDQVVRSFQKSSVPLLLNQGAVVTRNGASLYLAGADDPRYLSRRSSGFFRSTIDAAMSEAPSEAFSILLSHRPEGFDYAAEVDVDLVLAGHHHGTQVGLGGRSVFESVMPNKYLWGLYQSGSSQLYTSAGVGHWFPFRLGCPAEAPVLELRAGKSNPQS
jgi:predicted MPP superfamily phosphohydrolase